MYVRHPFIERLAKRGIIVNFDEREAFELLRKLECSTPTNDVVAITICPTLCGQRNFAYGTARDWDPTRPLETASNPDMLSKFLNTVTLSHDDKCYDCVWLPLCGGGCPQLRLFGKPECPAYRYDPETFVLAMHSRINKGKEDPE